MRSGDRDLVQVKHSFEIEIRQAEGREATLCGIVIQEGRAASERKEIFAPGSVQWPSTGIEIMPEHRGAVESRAHPVRASNGEIRISARATEALRQAVEQGKRFLSLEFFALEQRVTGGGIREITKCMMTGAALVSNPEYVQTSAEIRAKQGRRVWL